MKQHVCKPCENVYNCFWSRPALVLFTASLCLMGIAFVSMGSYVIKNDQIINRNIKTNWNEFLTDLSKMDWCTIEDDWRSDCIKPKLASQFRYTDAFETELNVTKAAKQMLRLTDETFVWTTSMRNLFPQEGLREEGRHKALVRVTLVLNQKPSVPVPKNQLWSLRMATVVLQANESLKLPCSKRPNAVNATQILAQDNATLMCECHSKDAASRLPFRVSHEDDPLLEIYFNMEERTNIHLHLMSTSYFLFTTAMVVVLYGFLRRRAAHHDGNTPHVDVI